MVSGTKFSILQLCKLFYDDETGKRNNCSNFSVFFLFFFFQKNDPHFSSKWVAALSSITSKIIKRKIVENNTKKISYYIQTSDFYRSNLNQPNLSFCLSVFLCLSVFMSLYISVFLFHFFFSLNLTNPNLTQPNLT